MFSKSTYLFYIIQLKCLDVLLLLTVFQFEILLFNAIFKVKICINLKNLKLKCVVFYFLGFEEDSVI